MRVFHCNPPARASPDDADGLLRPGPFLTAGVVGAVVGLIAMYLAPIFAARAKPTLLPTKPLDKDLADRLLIIRSRGDEPAAGLGFFYLVGWVVLQLWSWVARLVDQAFKRSYKFARWPRAVLAQKVAATTIAFIGLPIPFWTEYQEWLRTIWAELPVVIVVFMLPGSLLWLSFLGRYVVTPGLQMMFYVPLTLLAVFAIPFAPELILSSAHVDISAEPAPVGHHPVLELGGSTGRDIEDIRHVLSHSTYDDEECPPAIARWMCKSLLPVNGEQPA